MSPSFKHMKKNNTHQSVRFEVLIVKGKGKVFPLQAQCGPEGG